MLLLYIVIGAILFPVAMAFGFVGLLVFGGGIVVAIAGRELLREIFR